MALLITFSNKKKFEKQRKMYISNIYTVYIYLTYWFDCYHLEFLENLKFFLLLGPFLKILFHSLSKCYYEYNHYQFFIFIFW